MEQDWRDTARYKRQFTFSRDATNSVSLWVVRDLSADTLRRMKQTPLIATMRLECFPVCGVFYLTYINVCSEAMNLHLETLLI